MQQMKSGKAAGLDDMCAEQILNMEEAAKKWIFNLFSHCIETHSNQNMEKEEIESSR